MNNLNLRRVYVTKKQDSFDSSEDEKDVFKGYFHKWFKTINPISGTNEQYAIIETEEGTVSKVSLFHYDLKFDGIVDLLDL